MAYGDLFVITNQISFLSCKFISANIISRQENLIELELTLFEENLD
jgi:hypothetical protein